MAKKKKTAKKSMSRGATGKKTAKKATKKGATKKTSKKKTAARGKAGPLTKRNLGDRWSGSNLQKLRKMADENTPTRVIGLKLGRTPESVYAKASAHGLSLKPVNQSPMG